MDECKKVVSVTMMYSFYSRYVVTSGMV